MKYADKLQQTNREALMTLGALAFVVIVWLVCGFGLAGFDIKVFHVPLWVVGGLFGTWIAAIVCSVVLARAFKDFSLEDDEADEADSDAGAKHAIPSSGSIDTDLATESEVRNG